MSEQAIRKAEEKRRRRGQRPDASAYARGNAGRATAPAPVRDMSAAVRPRSAIDRRHLPAILAMLAALGGHQAEPL